MASMKQFLEDEAGAVTVDWVVLTAALAGIGIGIVAVVRSGAINAADETAVFLCKGDIDAPKFDLKMSGEACE